MKTIIAGSRTIKNYNIIAHAMERIGWEVTEVVSGCASGVDTLGEEWARKNNIPIKHFPANWGRFGKSAGYIRNKELAEYAEACVAIWDGNSNGTQHMINLARNMNLKLLVVKVKKEFLG